MAELGDEGASGGAGGKGEEGKGVTARFLLADLAVHLTQEDLHAYFSELGEIEEVTLRTIEGQSGARNMGSVKFLHPTFDIRKKMLYLKHEINGTPVSVQTWKMQKMSRPGYQPGKPAKGGAKGGALTAAPGGKGPWGLAPAFGAAAWDSWDYSYGGKGGKGGKGGDMWGMGAFMGGKGAGWGPALGGWGPALGPKGAPSGDIYGPPQAMAWQQPAAKGCGKVGKAAGKAAPEKELEVTARYLLVGLPAGMLEGEISTYFSTYGAIEEVAVKTLDNGKTIGSVKFSDPTPELRQLMLREAHEISGHTIIVQTHKMQKLAKPGYQQKILAEKAAKGAAKGARYSPW